MSDHRYAVFAMASGADVAPAAEADTSTGAQLAAATMAADGGTPGWYIIVDRQAPRGPGAARAVHADGRGKVGPLQGAHVPWCEAARETG